MCLSVVLIMNAFINLGGLKCCFSCHDPGMQNASIFVFLVVCFIVRIVLLVDSEKLSGTKYLSPDPKCVVPKSLSW